MNKLNFLVVIFSVTGFLQIDNKEKEACNYRTYEIRVQELSDTINYKSKKQLHKFTDTLLINRFSDEIRRIKKEDSINDTREVNIIFTGSSSIRKWKTLANDMPSCKVLNRGFGGSTIPEVIYYSDVLIFKYKPTKIVLYAGENDISAANSSELKVIQSFEYFQKLIRQQLPATQLYFVSIKPSPARWKLWPKMKSINKNIKAICDSSQHCSFIDISTPMFDKEGV